VGVRVHVYGATQADADKISAAAEALRGTERKVAYGTGEFIGTQLSDDKHTDAEQRADARSQYQRIINQAAAAGGLRGRDIEGVWRSAGNYWRTLPGTADSATQVIKPEIIVRSGRAPSRRPVRAILLSPGRC